MLSRSDARNLTAERMKLAALSALRGGRERRRVEGRKRREREGREGRGKEEEGGGKMRRVVKEEEGG